MPRWTPAELRAGPLRFLFDLDWGGRVYRLAEGEADGTFDGEILHYEDGLEFGSQWRDQIDMFAVSPQDRSISLTLHLHGIVDVPARIAEGHALGAATGKLWLWPEGAARRALLLEGSFRSIEYGAAEEPVSLTMEAAAVRVPGRIPLPLQRIQDPSDKAAAAPSVWDQYYPWIFGRPGPQTATTGGGSPALIYDDSGFSGPTASEAVVAAHPCVAGNVLVRNADDESSTGYVVLRAGNDPTTGVFRTYVLLDPATITNADVPMFVFWADTPSGATGAGYPSREDPSQPMRGAGDILGVLLEQSGAVVDFGRVAAVAPILNAYKLDFAIVPGDEERVNPLEFIEDQLVPVLPISARSVEGGLYYVLWRWDADLGDAIATLDADEGQADRVGAVEYSDADDVYQQIRVSYERDYRFDTFRSQLVYTGDPQAAEELGYILDPHLEQSFRRYAASDPSRVKVLEVNCEIAVIAETAHLIAAALARRHALQSRLVRYDCDPEFGWLEPGDVVAVRDSDVFGSQAQVGLVDQVIWSTQGRVGIAVRILERPRRHVT